VDCRLLAAGGAAAFLLASRRSGMALALGALAVAAAVAAGQVYDPPPASATLRELPENQPVVVEGVLDREPEPIRDVIRLYLRVERAGLEGARLHPATGRVRITVLNPASYRIGERMQVSGRLRFPRNYGDPGEFDYESYMAREGVQATALASRPDQIIPMGYQRAPLRSGIEAVRAHIGAFIDAGLDYPQRAEMRALIIGERGGIDRRLRDDFALTGMAHLLVISGLHLGFVASVAFVLIRLACIPFPPLLILGYANKLAAIGSGVAVSAYAVIAGTHVSTLRALIMVLCYVGAVLADRSREVLASLALAALIVCVLMPGSAADIGFQLSFAAVLGIVLGMRRYAAWWEDVREGVKERRMQPLFLAAGAVGGYLAVSFFALLATAPLTAFYFNQFSLVGLIANAVVVPVMALGGMVLGLMAAVLSFVWLPAAIGLLHVGGAAIAFANRLTELFVALPAAWVRIFTPNLFELALTYVLLALWLCAPVMRGRFIPPQPPAVWRKALATALVFALALDAAWWVRERYFDPRLRVTFLAVGQGDAAVVQFPGAAVMLIDGGGVFKDGSDMGERVVAPFLWSRKIMRVDYLAMSHPELDHFGGFLFIARTFLPAEFWSTGADSPDFAYHELLERLAAAGTRMRFVDSASPMRLIGGVTVRCLSPQPNAIASRNNNSMVLDLNWGRWGFLFTGDLEGWGERVLIDGGRPLRATVLKAPHHGSITSSTMQFVDAVQPHFVLISDGYRNRYHFPSPVVVNRYRHEGAIVLRTDLSGAVGFEADGNRIRAWTARSE
jgi:competence protein ComEC